MNRTVLCLLSIVLAARVHAQVPGQTPEPSENAKRVGAQLSDLSKRKTLGNEAIPLLLEAINAERSGDFLPDPIVVDQVIKKLGKEAMPTLNDGIGLLPGAIDVMIVITRERKDLLKEVRIETLEKHLPASNAMGELFPFVSIVTNLANDKGTRAKALPLLRRILKNEDRNIVMTLVHGLEVKDDEFETNDLLPFLRSSLRDPQTFDQDWSTAARGLLQRRPAEGYKAIDEALLNDRGASAVTAFREYWKMVTHAEKDPLIPALDKKTHGIWIEKWRTAVLDRERDFSERAITARILLLCKDEKSLKQSVSLQLETIRLLQGQMPRMMGMPFQGGQRLPGGAFIGGQSDPIQALADAGSLVSKMLTDGLKHRDDRVKIACIQAICEQETVTDLPALTKLISDKETSSQMLIAIMNAKGTLMQNVWQRMVMPDPVESPKAAKFWQEAKLGEAKTIIETTASSRIQNEKDFANKEALLDGLANVSPMKAIQETQKILEKEPDIDRKQRLQERVEQYHQRVLQANLPM